MSNKNTRFIVTISIIGLLIGLLSFMSPILALVNPFAVSVSNSYGGSEQGVVTLRGLVSTTMFTAIGCLTVIGEHYKAKLLTGLSIMLIYGFLYIVGLNNVLIGIGV